MSKKTDNEVLSIVRNELSNSDAYVDWVTPLNYYLGNPNGTEVEGRSQVTSTDVADSIEWILPQVMRSLTLNNEVVVFDPLGPEDEQQSKLESQYVYDVLMKENNGFIILHQFVKDALLHRNGIIKVYYEENNNIYVDSYSGVNQVQIGALLQSTNAELIEATEDIPGSYSIKIKVTDNYGRVCIENVPPEQFRVSPNHNSIDLCDARFTAHVQVKTYSDLREEGVSAKTLDELGNFSGVSQSEFRFTAQGESYDNFDSTEDLSMTNFQVAECYMKMDYNGDGIAERIKVTVAGVDTPSTILSIEEVAYSPWVATTGILMSHKFRGLSIFDRLKQIQDAKTALWRNMLDNIYLQNNQRNVVVENMVNLDDLLVSRPGGVIRAKRLDAITPLVTPGIGQDAYSMMEYLDGVRAGRVGVAPEGEASPPRIGERVGSEGVAQLLSAKEELVGLIVRVIAETGIKPLCVLIRDICTRHLNAIQDYKFQGQWVKINPADWRSYRKSTVRVGTGTGNINKKKETLAAILQMQKEIVAVPSQALVSPEKIFAAIDEFARLGELAGANSYFLDPQSEEGMQKKQEKDQMTAQEKQKEDENNFKLIESQVGLAQAELQKAQAQQENITLKANIENLKGQLELAKADADASSKQADRLLKKYEIDTKAALELTRIEVTAKQQQEANMVANKDILEQEDSTESEKDD